MKVRSITDEEIALIKAMINRGMKNKDIQFYFNKPERSVNSGRITGIQKGTYSNSAEISAATDKILNQFIYEHQRPPLGIVQSKNPLDPKIVKQFFEQQKAGSWKFICGESDVHECKENFGFRYCDSWLKAVAALANNKGGYIFFGIKDKKLIDNKLAAESYDVTGLSNQEFENADPAEFTKKIKATFDPTPRVETTVISFGKKKLGLFYIHQHPSRPIIATKQEGVIREGDIFFRYPGQSMRIKYSDLRSMLDERDRHTREQVLPMLSKILTLGPQEAMIADLSQGSLSDAHSTITISEDLLDQIQFIKEGEFDYKSGAPTLRLIGDVQTVGSMGGAVHRAFVTPNDLISDFINLKSPSDPKEYIRCAVEGGNGAWLPLHYYARKAGLPPAKLADNIMKMGAPEKRRQMWVDRVAGKITAFQPAGGPSQKLIEEIQTGKFPKIANAADARAAGKAICGLKTKPSVDLKKILEFLVPCTEALVKEKDTSGMSVLRRATARLDELFFANPSAKNVA